MGDKQDLRQQFVEAFEGADYPVNSPMDLVPALPEGPQTEFKYDGESFTAMEIQQQGGGQGDFPYDSVDSLVDDLMQGMEDEGFLD
ncbi:MAG: MTH865 family protein [Halobacteriales archaeon]